MENDPIKKAIQELLQMLKENKPDDRSELDRRHAIILTDLEKIMAYYDYYIVRYG
jgi:hypothetical protein